MTRTTELELLTALLIAAVVVPRLRPRWLTWQRVAWRLATFTAVSVLVVRAMGSPLQPQFGTARPGLLFWEQLVDAGWWLLGGRVAVGFVRLLLVLENRPRETRIVSDLVAGAIYVTTFLAIVSFVFAVPIRGLLATSGVIAIVLGLALQSTLSDVFSGIAVGLERPYKPGDLLWVEGGIEGQVIQVNWRSTQISTEDRNVAVVPNSVIAKARLINRSAPTTQRGDSVRVRLDPRALPEHCRAALDAAARTCRVLLAEPRPLVWCVGLFGDGSLWEVSFSVASNDVIEEARTELFSQVHRHLRHAGIGLAVQNTINVVPASVSTPAELLDKSDWFSVLEPSYRGKLAGFFEPVSWQAGEVIIRPGETAKALFVLASGVVEITSADTGRVAYRMGPGETLGAIGLITGAPFKLLATALTPVSAFAISKENIAAAMREEPGLAAGLEMLAARGIAVLRRGITTQDDAELAEPEQFLARLRSFVRLLRA